MAGGHHHEDPAVTRAARLAGLGHGSPSREITAELATAAVDDPAPAARAAALGALASLRADELHEVWRRSLTDPDSSVRRRAADLAPAVASAGEAPAVAHEVLTLLDDHDVTVLAATAWALGELGPEAVEAGAVAPLATTTITHEDPLAREAAVAALGALGDPNGLPAILEACTDKPPVRRRAVLALAPHEGPEREAALQHALQDKDWQVRQAAEDLLGGHAAAPE